MKVALGCATGAIIAAALGLTHRSFSAQVGGNEPITVHGSVTRVEWTNPHAYFYLDVEDASGDPSSWAFEMGSLIALKRYGWTPRSLKVGDEVQVDGFLARDGSPLVNTSSVLILGTGQRLEAATGISATN